MNDAELYKQSIIKWIKAQYPWIVLLDAKHSSDVYFDLLSVDTNTRLLEKWIAHREFIFHGRHVTHMQIHSGDSSYCLIFSYSAYPSIIAYE